MYADVFSHTYGIECIGLRYFNVFVRRQDFNVAYAVVIPLFVKIFIKHESRVINGDGEYSRDFTYVDNVVHVNLMAIDMVRILQEYDVNISIYDPLANPAIANMNTTLI